MAPCWMGSKPSGKSRCTAGQVQTQLAIFRISISLLLKTHAMTRRKERNTNCCTLPLALILSFMLFQPLAGAFAQNTFVKGGINISSVAGIEEKGSLTGFHVGVGGIKQFSSRLGVKHELIFSQQGTRI